MAVEDKYVEVTPGSASGSGAGSFSFTCPECERIFESRVGARLHFVRKHPEFPVPPELEKPAEVPRGTSSGPEPEKAPTAELRKVQQQLEESIGMVGGLLAGLLGGFKETAITARVSGVKVQVPPLFQRGPLRNLQPFNLPYLETTLGHVIVEDAPLSAGIVMRYAARNPTLLRWVERFNAFCHLEGDGKVLVDHLAGAVHTLSPQNHSANWYLAWQKESVMLTISQENEKLQAKINQLQAQLAAQQASTSGNGRKDERGTG